jgi:hypothetical protein
MLNVCKTSVVKSIKMSPSLILSSQSSLPFVTKHVISFFGWKIVQFIKIGNFMVCNSIHEEEMQINFCELKVHIWF